MRLHYYRAIIMDSDEGQIKSSYLVPFGSFHVHNVCNLSDVVVRRCRGIDVVISSLLLSFVVQLNEIGVPLFHLLLKVLAGGRVQAIYWMEIIISLS